MSNSGCTMANRDELALDYLHDRLGDEARESYEVHFVGCAACQNELLVASAVRGGLGRRGNLSGKAAAAGAVALAAAALVTFMAFPSRTDPAALAALGRLDAPPVYLGVAVRGTAAADSALDPGLRLYDEGRWTEARAALANAVTLGAPADVARFFAGAAALMEGRAADAESEFAAVLRAGDSPYTDEAHFYRARALLLLGRPREALDALARVRDGSAASAQATALADSMRILGVR